MTALDMMTRAGSPIQLTSQHVDKKTYLENKWYLRIKLAISCIWNQHAVTKEVPCSLGFFGKGDDIGRGS
jgi:hypothetical protein